MRWADNVERSKREMRKNHSNREN